MKKLIIFLLVLWSGQLWAQSALTIFAEEGEKFTVFLNSVQQNKVPQANVKVEGIKDNVQKVRIVFEDKLIPVLSDNLYYEPNQEYTCVIKKKNTTKNKVKRIDGKNVAVVYVLRLQDVKPLTNKGKEASKLEVLNNAGNGNDGSADDGSGEPNNTNVSTTTTITDVSTTNQGENVNINVGVNGVGINMNINDLGAANTNTNTTTTTSSSSTKTKSRPETNNNKGVAKPASRVCAPMNVTTFGSVVEQIKKQSFEDNKLNVIKQALTANCVSAKQVKQLMGEFPFEENKLKVAKMCYDRTTDKNNYFTLNDSFSFSSSADELHQFLESKGAVIDGE